MSLDVKATFDGEVFRPKERVELPPDTDVVLTVRPSAKGGGQPGPAVVLESTIPPGEKTGEPGSSLRIMMEADLDGPPDWSVNIHKYLYGEGCRGDDSVS